MLENSRFQTSLSISQLVAKVFENIIGFVSIIIIFCGISIYSSLNSPKIFEIKSLLQMDDARRSPFADNNTGFVFDFGNTNLNEQSYIYLSRSNLRNLTNSLKLNVSIDNELYDHSKNEYFNDISLVSSYVEQLEINLNPESYSIINFANSNEYLNLEYNRNHTIDGIKITISRDDKTTYVNRRINASFEPVELFLASLRQMFLVNTVQRSVSSRDTLFESILFTTDPSLGVKILDAMNTLHIGSSVQKNSYEAQASVDFIEEQIGQIQKILSNDEKLLNEFKKENMLIRESEETRAYFSTLTRIDEAISELTVEKAEKSNFYEEESQALRSLENQIKILEQEKSNVLEEVSNLPEKERQLFSLSRNVKLNQNVLEILQTRKLEFSIIKASTISDVSIIDPAYVSDQVAPRPALNLAIALIFSLLISMFYVFWRGFIQAKFTSPSRLNEIVPDIASIGIVPKVENTDIFQEEGSEKELINTLMANFKIYTRNIENNVVLITGSLQSIGKSFVSSLLAETLANNNQKVLLIDADYRRGMQYKKYLKHRNSILITDEVDSMDLSTNIENLDLISGFKGIKNGSVALFDSPKFNEFLQTIKKKYDYVIFDTPPSLMISDASILAQYTEMIVHIVRHNQTREKDFLSSYELLSALGEKKHYYIYNDFSRSVGSYFYNYYSYYQTRYYGDYHYSENKND